MSPVLKFFDLKIDVKNFILLMFGEIILLGYLPLLVYRKIKKITIKTHFSLNKTN